MVINFFLFCLLICFSVSLVGTMIYSMLCWWYFIFLFLWELFLMKDVAGLDGWQCLYFFFWWSSHSMLSSSIPTSICWSNLIVFVHDSYIRLVSYFRKHLPKEAQVDLYWMNSLKDPSMVCNAVDIFTLSFALFLFLFDRLCACVIRLLCNPT